MQPRKLSQHLEALCAGSKHDLIRAAPAAPAEARPAYREGCLIKRLAETRARHAPSAAPPPALCCAEPDLVMQVCSVPQHRATAPSSQPHACAATCCPLMASVGGTASDGRSSQCRCKYRIEQWRQTHAGAAHATGQPQAGRSLQAGLRQRRVRRHRRRARAAPVARRAARPPQPLFALRHTRPQVVAAAHAPYHDALLRVTMHSMTPCVGNAGSMRTVLVYQDACWECGGSPTVPSPFPAQAPPLRGHRHCVRDACAVRALTASSAGRACDRARSYGGRICGRAGGGAARCRGRPECAAGEVAVTAAGRAGRQCQPAGPGGCPAGWSSVLSS